MRTESALWGGSLLIVAAGCGSVDERLTVSHLRWDAREKPLGFVQFEPRLAWSVAASERGQRQTAYQILVATSPDKLRVGSADIWDSGKVVSGETLDIHYGGATPKARERAFWTVRAWGRDGRASSFAAPSWWEMGLYDEEWEGKWIGRPARAREVRREEDRSVIYLRKAFEVGKPAQRARLYVSAFGVYEIYINGERAGTDVLAPGFTDYEKRVLFQSHDVTSLMKEGGNVIGAIVGGGWCTAALGGRSGACGLEPPRVMLQLEVTSHDGSLQVIDSDESWTSHAGPLVSSHLYDGETYDARLEMPGWSTPGFDARGWEPVQQYDREKERDLVADPGPATKVAQDVLPREMRETSPGVYVFDLGQNIVGWVRLALSVPRGTAVTLRLAEALRSDGALYVDNLRSAKATHQYIARGGGEEIWEPRFSVNGFRFVEVRGLPVRPPMSAMTGRVVHSEMAETGALATSNPKLDRLFANIQWSQRGAFLGLPITGPQRDERAGSMREAQAFALTGCLNYDVQTLYRKWIDDLRDAQHPNAAYSDAAPRVNDREGPPAAAVAGVLVPWATYRCYADRTAIDAHLPSMGRFLDRVRAEHPDLIWRGGTPRNGADPGEIGETTDSALLDTADLIGAADALSRMMQSANPLLESSARRYEQMAEDTRAAFAKAFVRPDGRLTSDTQSAYALAIGRGALSAEARVKAGEHFARTIERSGRHLTTGVRGSALLLPALSLVGRDDLAYAVLLEESCPSWLCSVQNGATTMWERWDGWTNERGFADAASNSMNHYALGAVGEWLYDAVGGIALDPSRPAGRHVFVKPRPGGGLTSARSRYDSLYGTIRTEWSLGDGLFRLKLVVPAGGGATVTIPFGGRVTEGRSLLAKAMGVKVIEEGGGRTVLEVESGSYDFVVPTR